MRKFIQSALRLRKDEKGVTLVEYGIALILAIAVGGAIISNLSNNIVGNMEDASSALLER